MNYDLAKQLKDAGFPQIEPLTHFEDKCGDKPGIKLASECYLKMPTLDELIEACGTLDLKIRDEYTEVRKLHAGNWSSGLLKIKGSTPTEAVARLWLALRATA